MSSPTEPLVLVVHRAPLLRSILRRPLCWLGRHSLWFKRRGVVRENWENCVYCGRYAFGEEEALQDPKGARHE